MGISKKLSQQPVVLERISLPKFSTAQERSNYINKLFDIHGEDVAICQSYEDPNDVVVTRMETKQEYINRLIKLMNELEFHFRKEHVELKRQRILTVLSELGS